MSADRNAVTILMYHQVGRFAQVRAHRALYCDAGAFRRQMAFLKAGRYAVLSLADVLAVARGEKAAPPRAVHLSFDDGYANFADVCVPAMRRHGFPSSVYAVTDLIGKDAAWLPEEGLPSAPLMDADTLRRLDADPLVTIGSHTMGHARLAGLPASDLEREVSGSRAALEDVLGHAVTAFCYPFGSVDAAALAAVRRAGYDSALTCERNRVFPGTNPLLLPRHAVSQGTSLAGLWWKLHFQKPGKPLAL